MYKVNKSHIIVIRSHFTVIMSCYKITNKNKKNTERTENATIIKYSSFIAKPSSEFGDMPWYSDSQALENRCSIVINETFFHMPCKTSGLPFVCKSIYFLLFTYLWYLCNLYLFFLSMAQFCKYLFFKQ